jgi:SAM-dependent methyltransferase
MGRRAAGTRLFSMSSLYDDPQLYDLLFQPEPFLSFYRALAKSQSGSVLELGCGSGQLLIPISKLGYRCVGLDIHSGMLAVANARAGAAGTHVSIVEADMRSFSFRERFSLIFVARNSLLHLHTYSDFDKFFCAAKEHLEPDGLLAFDVFNPSIAILAKPSGLRELVQRVSYPGRGTVTVEASADYDPECQVNRATWYASSESEEDYLVAPIHLRCIFPEELLLMIDHFGFDLEGRYGDFSYTPFRASSRQQVCLCRAAA